MRIKTVIASAMLVGSGLLMAPGAASAALSDCPSNHMCMWGNNDFKWKIGDRNHGSENIVNLSGDKNNEMDSWANRSATYRGCMYASADGGGDKQTMATVSSDNNVAPWNSDEVSSWKTFGGCGS